MSLPVTAPKTFTPKPVSYTHLDVYKRQVVGRFPEVSGEGLYPVGRVLQFGPVEHVIVLQMCIRDRSCTSADPNLAATVKGTALAFGLSVVAMAYTIGGVSGCHINPAITLGCLLSGRMSLSLIHIWEYTSV